MTHTATTSKPTSNIATNAIVYFFALTAFQEIAEHDSNLCKTTVAIIDERKTMSTSSANLVVEEMFPQKKNLKQLFEKMAKSDWYKETYHDRSIGELIEIE